MAGYAEFKSKGRVFRHIQDGWCARQIDYAANGEKVLVWRMFFGPVQPGAEKPTYVVAYEDPEVEEFVQFDDFADCVRWVKAREVVR